MRLIFHLFFCVCLLAIKCGAQEGIEGNLWLSGQFTYQTPKAQHFADAGFRSYNYFIRDSRQFLIRYHSHYKLGGDNFWLGGGISLFETAQSNQWNPELRPFLQFCFIKSYGNWMHRVRYRNELRYYTNQNVINDRNRIQFWTQYTLKGTPFRFQAAYEPFYTIDLDKPWENRWSTGIQIQCGSNFFATAQYMLQRQQRFPNVNQHTILLGFIYQVTGPNSSKNNK